MQKKATKYLLVIWFAILLLIGNTPMDFIHQFADHKDTVHHNHKGLVIENKHHHCAFLSLTLTSFVNDYQVPVVVFSAGEFITRRAAISANYVQRAIVAASLRGPPQA